jgi:[NiFe] hydrogenase diaphorase moiety small subunit
MSDETFTIFIDGVEVEAKPGQTILQAADAAGIYIPRLCYHPSLPPGGHCRMCTVKVNGRPASSCTFPASEGQVIENATEELMAMRRCILEMLFVEGNHYCPSCEASGNCELQALAYRLGLTAKRLAYLTRPREIDTTHPDVMIDRDRCILCGRCVRASKYLDGKTALGFEGRGLDKRLAVNSKDGLKETDLADTDEAARICPTGSLMVKRESYLTPIGRRPFDKKPIGSDIEQKRRAG